MSVSDSIRDRLENTRVAWSNALNGLFAQVRFPDAFLEDQSPQAYETVVDREWTNASAGRELLTCPAWDEPGKALEPDRQLDYMLVRPANRWKVLSAIIYLPLSLGIIAVQTVS